MMIKCSNTYKEERISWKVLRPSNAPYKLQNKSGPRNHLRLRNLILNLARIRGKVKNLEEWAVSILRLIRITIRVNSKSIKPIIRLVSPKEAITPSTTKICPRNLMFMTWKSLKESSATRTKFNLNIMKTYKMISFHSIQVQSRMKQWTPKF